MKHRLVVAAGLFCLLLSATPAGFAEGTDQDKSPLSTEEWQLYRLLSSRIKESYVEEVDDKRLFNACLSGMGRLDPHSEYLDAEAFQAMKSNPDVAAVGLELQIKNHRAVVVSVIEDTPAAQAGIRAGDSILKIDGKIIYDVPLTQVVNQLRGKPDTTLRLTVGRDGTAEPLTFDLTRKHVTTQTVKSSMLEPGYGYVRITAFHDNTIEKFVEAIQALDKQNGGEPKGLVLDLRNNPGGLFKKALALAGVFLPEDATLVAVKGRTKEATHDYKNRPDIFDLNLSRVDYQALEHLPFWVKQVPLVALVNGQSAAGVEIIVGALQDYRRALVVGTPTFGKDSIQTIIPISLRDDAALKLTTGRWQTPNGRSSAPAGIAPDIVVAASAKDAVEKADPALDRALVSLKSRYAKDTQPEPSAADKSAIDTLRKAAFAANDAHQTANAIELWSQLLNVQPDDAQALRLRGVLYSEEGKRDLATADQLRAVELEPESPNTWNSRCWSKIVLGDFADAQADCKKAGLLDRAHLPATVNMGHTWLLRGDKDQAWKLYEPAQYLIESKEDLADILADFDLFKKRGWQPELSQAGQDWFAKQGKAWLARRAPADELIPKIRAAVAAKDAETELKLRIERFDQLEKLFPSSYPLVAFSANALADTYIQSKQPDKAVPLYLRIMNYLAELDGNPPRGLITVINKIIDALDDKTYTGKDTLRAWDQMYDVVKRHWGRDSPFTQSVVRRLAAASVEEKPSLALSLAKDALAYQEQHDAPVEKQVNTIYTILSALGKQDKFEECIPYLEKILALLNQHKEENLKSIIDASESLGDVHSSMSHTDQALSYYKQVLEMRRSLDSNLANSGYIKSLGKIARALTRAERLNEATPYLEEALSLAEKLSGKDGVITQQIAKYFDKHKLRLEKRDKPEVGKAP